MKPLPQDSNGRVMYDRARELGGKNYSDVDSTTGIVFAPPIDIKGFIIVPTAADSATPYYITGTISGFTDAVEVTGERGYPVTAKAGDTVCTIKAKTGTIDIGIQIVR